MRTRYIAAAVAVAIATSLGTISSAEAASPVRLTRAYYNSPGADSGSNSSLDHEWVRVHNFGDRSRTLTGWRLRDAQGHVFRFPTFRLRAGASVTIHTGRGSNTRTDLYWGKDWYVWNNDGDTAALKSKAGIRVDRCHYGGGDAVVNC